MQARTAMAAMRYRGKFSAFREPLNEGAAEEHSSEVGERARNKATTLHDKICTALTPKCLRTSPVLPDLSNSKQRHYEAAVGSTDLGLPSPSTVFCQPFAPFDHEFHMSRSHLSHLSSRAKRQSSRRAFWGSAVRP